MTTLLSRLADARTIETPAATMRTLASPGFGPGLDPALPVSVWRTEVAAGVSMVRASARRLSRVVMSDLLWSTGLSVGAGAG